MQAIATNTRIFGKLNPNRNPPAMPKIHECVGVSRGGAIAVFSLARNPDDACLVVDRRYIAVLNPTVRRSYTEDWDFS
jgi:hypothetical protein